MYTRPTLRKIKIEQATTPRAKRGDKISHEAFDFGLYIYNYIFAFRRPVNYARYLYHSSRRDRGRIDLLMNGLFFQTRRATNAREYCSLSGGIITLDNDVFSRINYRLRAP